MSGRGTFERAARGDRWYAMAATETGGKAAGAGGKGLRHRDPSPRQVRGARRRDASARHPHAEGAVAAGTAGAQAGSCPVARGSRRHALAHSPPSLGLYNLRRCLTEIRQALGQHSERLRSPTARSLLLEIGDEQVDAAVFRAAARGGDLASLERAVALYRGSLLEGCAEEWVLEEREALRQVSSRRCAA